MDLNLEDYLCNFEEPSSGNENIENVVKWLNNCEWTNFFSRDIDLEDISSSGRIPENEILATGVAFLLAFVQENFVGPKLNAEHLNSVLELASFNDLMVNGVELNSNVNHAGLLVASKRIFDYLVQSDKSSIVFNWWKLRQNCVHQRVLEERTNSLYEEFTKTAQLLLEKRPRIQSTKLQALLLTEISQGYLIYHRPQKADSMIEEVCEALDIEMVVQGLLGVRTKFQQKPLPQLCLNITKKSEGALLNLPPSSATHGNVQLPKLLQLDDDVRLEKIKFIDGKDTEDFNISSAIQAIVLAKCLQVIRSQPKDKLASEEVSPYLTTLLYQEAGPLSLRLSILLVNIHQESDHRRTVDRSLKQCEELLDLLTTEKFSVREKLSYIFASSIPPRWDVQKTLADLMISLGLTKTALDIYLNIESWEDVIFCYTHLELRHKAAEVIRNELEKKPTVKLYCLLGDATDDISCYEKAWQFSNQTSGRAQRHWGNYLFAKKDYEHAIPHLEKSLEINSLQEVVWLRLGYAAILLENWELAVKAYLRYTHLEPHGFESWNNLAKALIKLGDKKRAHKILSEALKCNFNNWKVWENFLLVSVDTGNFEDAINAMVRLTELKEKYTDLQVLEIIVGAVVKDLPDAQGRPSRRLKKKLISLLGQQCASHGNVPKLWVLAAEISESPLGKAQKLQKAYRAYTQRNGASWVNEMESCLNVMQICRDLGDASLEALTNHEESEKTSVLSQISSARLSLQACIRTVESKSEKSGDINGLIECLQELLNRVTSELKSRM